MIVVLIGAVAYESVERAMASMYSARSSKLGCTVEIRPAFCLSKIIHPEEIRQTGTRIASQKKQIMFSCQCSLPFVIVSKRWTKQGSTSIALFCTAWCFSKAKHFLFNACALSFHHARSQASWCFSGTPSSDILLHMLIDPLASSSFTNSWEY
jgi:hypothetical protein